MVRAAAFGVATAALASGAHVSAGGALPPVPVLVFLTLPLTMAAVILTSRKCGLVLLLSALTAAQVLLHETLMALTAHVPGEMFAAEVGAHHGVQSLVSGQVSAHSASAMGSAVGDVALAGADGWSGAMKAAHVVATIVTALLLARGEQALWLLVARLLPTLPGMPRLLSCGPRRTPVLLSVPALRPCLVSGGSGLRGPPAGFPATAQVL